MDVTVAICTWNRAGLLEQTLTRMRELIVPAGVRWELLVVNNNCSDGTDEVIARHEKALPLRRLHEPRQGLSHARNCAVAAAQGDLLIWTDDDVLVDRSWLAEHVRASRDWPKAAFFGGHVAPWFSRTPPRWIRRHFAQIDHVFAVKQLGQGVRPLAGDELPFGANVAFRTQLLRQFPFDVRLGHNGDKLVGWEETDVILRMRQQGHEGVWVGTAQVQHYIPPERLTARYYWNWIQDSTERECREATPLPGVRVLGAPRWLWRRYFKHQMLRFLLSPFGNEMWLKSLRNAAYYRGVINAEQKRVVSQ